jgi:hypothetical protein
MMRVSKCILLHLVEIKTLRSLNTYYVYCKLGLKIIPNRKIKPNRKVKLNRKNKLN